jgi:hypothetical protein
MSTWEQPLNKRRKAEVRRRGEKILRQYKTLTNESATSPISQENVVDTIADLLHYATKRHWDLDELTRTARKHFDFEEHGENRA